MCLTEKNSKEFIPVYRKIKKKTFQYGVHHLYTNQITFLNQ